MQTYYSISRTARRAGVHRNTVKKYIEKGIVTPVRRGTRTIFTDEDVELIKTTHAKNVESIHNGSNLGRPKGFKKVPEPIDHPCLKLPESFYSTYESRSEATPTQPSPGGTQGVSDYGLTPSKE